MPNPWEMDWSGSQPSGGMPASGLNIRTLPQKMPAQTPAQAQKDVLEVQKLQGELGKKDDPVKKNMALEATNELLDSINRAKGLTSHWSTGWPAAALRHLPDTDAAKLDTIINQEIRGNIFKNWVGELKSQTDTGTSGIGRIMQSEIPLITGSLGALDPEKMGYDETIRSLNQIQNRVLRSKAVLSGENPDDPRVKRKYGIRNFVQPAPQGSGGISPDVQSILNKYGVK